MATSWDVLTTQGSFARCAYQHRISGGLWPRAWVVATSKGNGSPEVISLGCLVVNALSAMMSLSQTFPMRFDGVLCRQPPPFHAPGRPWGVSALSSLGSHQTG